MKRFFILMMVILLLLPTVTYAEEGETSTTTETEGVTELANGSFETDENDDNCPDGWECSVDGDGTYDILTNPVHKGAQSFMTYDNNTDGYNIIEQVEVAVTPGITYMASVWHRTNNVSDSPYIQLIFKDANGDQIQGEKLYADADLNPTHDWKEISGKVTAPQGAATVDFRLAQDGVSGSIYWDSASIKDVGNVMFNGGFEMDTDQWTSNSVGNVSVDQSDSAEGVRSIKLSATADEEVVVEQDGAINGGVWYRFQGSVKTDNDDSALQVQWMDASGNIIDEESIIASSSEWDEIAKDIQAPVEAVKVNVQVTHQGTGATWWDMVNVEQLPEIEDFGSQAFTLHTNNGTFDDHYAYTVTTLGYNFGKIDLNDGSLEVLLQANSNSLGTMLHSNGKVYLTTDGVQVYDPETEKITSLNLPTGCNRINGLFELSDGKVWGTCYGPSRLFTYDPDTEEYEDLGVIDNERSYLFDAVEYKNKVFLSLGSPGALYVYDKDTGETERILENLDESKHVRGIKLYGDRLFVKRVNPTDAVVVDPDTYEEIAHLEYVYGELAPPDAENRVVFTYDDKFNYFDLDDDSIGIMESEHVFPNSGNVGVVQLDDQVNFPGSSYAGISNSGNAWVWNPQTDAYKEIPIPMPSAASKTYQLTVGGDGYVYGVGVQGAGSFRVNPDDPLTTETFSGPGQAEGMAAIGDYIYFGNYPYAVFYRQNIHEPWNPETIFDLGDSKQNRPVAMKAYDGKIYAGSIADRGYLTGSLAVYDPETEEVKEYKGLSPDQSITSLAVKGDYAYLGTTIHGGLSTSPITEEGKLVVFNLATEQVEETIIPLEGNEVVSALTIGPDGNVWGIGGGDLFVYDTNTKEVTTQTLYDDVGQSHSWGVYGSMLLAQDGNVYGSAGNRLFRLDADKNLTTLFQSANVRRVVEDHQGRIWFSGGPDQTLMRYNTVATSDEETDTTALSEVISTANSLVEEAVVGDEVGQYPQAAVDALEAAIADAESVLAGNDADQVEVDGAVTSLDQAVTTFKAAVITEASLDTTVLSSAISEANDKVSNAEVGEEEGEYPQTAVDALEAAIADAESVLADNEADQAEVDAAVITLNQASAAFEAAVITDNPGDDSSIPDPNAEVLVSVKAEEFSVEKSVENMMAFEYTDAATEYQGQMHLGGTRDGRWTAYENIDFTGATDIVFTQATNKNGGSVELRLDSKGGELIGSYEITDSEGTFDVVEKLNVPISTVEGTHDLYLVYKATHTTSVAHIISFDLVRDSSIPDPNAEVLVSVKAEDFSAEKSVENMSVFEYTGAATEYQGRYHLGGTRDGRWTAYEGIDFTGAKGIVFTQATNKTGGAVDLRLDSKDGQLIGSYEITESAGTFDVVEKVNVPISTVEGTHDLYLVYRATHTTAATHIIEFELVAPGTGEDSVDKTVLSSAISEANSKVSEAEVGEEVGEYPQAAADALEAAIAAAEAVLADDEADQAEVDGAVTALNEAVVTFEAAVVTEAPVDTTVLSSTISEANSKVSEAEVGEEVGEYPQTAVDALETAIAAAEAVLADDEADQAEVDGAVTALNEAVVTFEAAVVTEAPVDTTVLSSAISEANSKVSEAEVGEEVGEYPQTAVDALETAIAAAEAVLADDEADQAEVDGAVTALNEAVVTFEAAVVTEAPVETTVLSSALSEANRKLSEAEVGEEVGEYPQTAADALETAIADAEAVLQDEDADQTEVDGAVTTLNQAVESFEAAVIQETPESPLTGVDVDQADVLLEVDETVQLTVKATYEDETSSDVTEAASYSSSDEDVVKVTSAGEVKAVGVGSAQITITYKGETTTVAVKVYSTSIKTGEAVEVVPGEVFTINGSSASIKMPEDLPAGTTVTVVETTDVEHAGYEVAGDVYTVEFTYPDGTTVNGSFTLTLGYDADKYDADDVSIFYYNEETGEWEHQGGVAADGVITLDIPHFSTYGVFAEVDDDDASDDADDELPDTATSTYNWILAGVIFLVLGLAFIIVLKRKDLLARFGKSKE